ncbi:MAG: alternative ribosome rescue aminoacyl-tRNA hydrolase ArfB [bacterium]|nr:alternative ribosome rescue aminoacyl-tRNA hydrolase ArfB [bacterium]
MSKTEIRIPNSEYRISFARSGGKGGQNVDKVETKVVLHWNFRKSATLNEEQKEKILKYGPLANRINNDGYIVLHEQSERTQKQNKKLAIEKLDRLIEKALKFYPKRVATKPTRSSQKKRIKEKKAITVKKNRRLKLKDWNDE